MRLTGYETTDSLSFASYLKGVRLRELISAGVIIGSMGAVMDVAMSMSTAMHEIHQKSRILAEKNFLFCDENGKRHDRNYGQYFDFSLHWRQLVTDRHGVYSARTISHDTVAEF